MAAVLGLGLSQGPLTTGFAAVAASPHALCPCPCPCCTGALFNPVDCRAYLPLPCPHLPLGSVYLAVEYEVSRGCQVVAEGG